MHSLVIQRNMTKRATEEDGPSFEQQFGILANAVISDKFPQLDSMKLAFQLIDKTDDNTKACGASVYIVGKTVIFVPAFFRNGNLKTGDMMLIGATQQFLPMSDPWLSWIKNKDLLPAGEAMPADGIDMVGTTKGTTIRQIADPIIKTASVYLKGLCKLDPDLTKTAANLNVLDTALHMGKQATESMLDNLMKEDMLNATLSFYEPEDLQKFASSAQAMDPAPAFKVIMPFDKEAHELKGKELNALYKDGFFIKCAKEGDVPTVIKKKRINDMFGILKEGGKAGLLQPDGAIKDAYVFKLSGDLCCCGNGDRGVNSYTANRDGIYPARPFSEPVEFLVVTGGKCTRVKQGIMELLSDREEMTEDMFDGIGKSLKATGTDEEDRYRGGWIICANGEAYHVWGIKRTAPDTWVNGGIKYQLAEDDSKLRKPMMTAEDLYMLPPNSRFISDDDKEPSISFVTMANLDAFLDNYTSKNYKKARIYHNGSDYTVSGDMTQDGDKLLSFKEAALALVSDYGVAPADAKIMLKDASNGATYDNPKSTSYLIEKLASETGGWQDANIPMDQFVNKPPQLSQREMPTFIEDPAQLEQAVTTAAQDGIKEVFDVTVLKLLVKQNRFFDEIHDDLPMFMQCLDSLCRKLFQFYWHTEKMEEKYGMVKLKALEESLKVTIDSLSELTIFFKLRTVDGTGSTGDSLGDLMTGQMF